ncbi:kinase-like domain-containing protein [Melampsora americana]|nr:kinase-like domain-containing protein [Melampsora americana]
MPSAPNFQAETISSVSNSSSKHSAKIRRFHVSKTLGQGSFATVMLVRKAESKNGKLYALKVISKDALTQPHHVQHVKDERDVLRLTPPHPNILKLNESFSDQTRLFFTLEYFGGGNLHQLMEHFRRPFTETEAKFYAIQIARGLQHLHDHEIIYRDLKPENIVIRENGQIALCDFGFSKFLKNQNGTTSTFCGSPDFMAPELIKGDQYNFKIDWWSFGILIFDLIVFSPPFNFDPMAILKANSQTLIFPCPDLTNQEKFHRILRGIYAFPFQGDYTKEVRKLVAGLLQSNPIKRFKGKKVLKHSWFFKVDPDAAVPPWIPETRRLSLNFDDTLDIEFGYQKSDEVDDIFAGF